MARRLPTGEVPENIPPIARIFYVFSKCEIPTTEDSRSDPRLFTARRLFCHCRNPGGDFGHHPGEAGESFARLTSAQAAATTPARPASAPTRYHQV